MITTPRITTDRKLTAWDLIALCFLFGCLGGLLGLQFGIGVSEGTRFATTGWKCSAYSDPTLPQAACVKWERVR